MRRRPVLRTPVRAALGAAVAAAVVLSAGTAPPLSALPVPGDDGGPVERPPVTRPPSTTTTTTGVPRALESLTVTVDSVVATATVRFAGASPGIVTVEWGDGTSTSRNPSDPVDSPFPDPWATDSPPGTIVLQHAYAAPSDGSAFARTVTARIGAETEADTVAVTPRYRVTQYQASLQQEMRCDSNPEEYSEWRVVRRAGGLPDKTWEWDVPEPDWVDGDEPGPFDGYPFPPRPLTDSVISFDLTADQETRIGYEVTEDDPVIDNLGWTEYIDVDPHLGSRRVYLYWSDFGTGLGGDCSAHLYADIDVRLLTPGLGGGPVASQ
jgi:hypothetical protein